MVAAGVVNLKQPKFASMFPILDMANKHSSSSSEGMHLCPSTFQLLLHGVNRIFGPLSVSGKLQRLAKYRAQIGSGKAAVVVGQTHNIVLQQGLTKDSPAAGYVLETINCEAPAPCCYLRELPTRYFHPTGTRPGLGQ